jgi:hypothetical protein
MISLSMSMSMSREAHVGEILESCKIIAESDLHYYLEHNSDSQWFDIVLPKYENDNHEDPHNFLNLLLKIGDSVTVKIYTINIAFDGIPGAFVTFIKNE